MNSRHFFSHPLDACAEVWGEDLRDMSSSEGGVEMLITQSVKRCSVTVADTFDLYQFWDQFLRFWIDRNMLQSSSFEFFDMANEICLKDYTV